MPAGFALPGQSMHLITPTVMPGHLNRDSDLHQTQVTLNFLTEFFQSQSMYAWPRVQSSSPPGVTFLSNMYTQQMTSRKTPTFSRAKVSPTFPHTPFSDQHLHSLQFGGSRVLALSESNFCPTVFLVSVLYPAVLRDLSWQAGEARWK